VSTQLQKQIATALAIPDAFRETALAFPDKMATALALLDDPVDVADLLSKAGALADYCKRIKADTEITNAITFGKLKIIARLGELMPAAPPGERGQGRNGSAKKSIPPAGIDLGHNTVVAYRKVAKHKHRLADYYAAESEEMSLRGFIRFATGASIPWVCRNTGYFEWYTPPEYIAAAREVLGEIDLDPASSEKAQETVRAKQFFTIDDDGLARQWDTGSVWLNPPYAAKLVAPFVARLIEHVRAGNEALLLVNNATQTRWFQAAAGAAAAICFPAGRVTFFDDGETPGQPLQGQAVLYFGQRPRILAEAFGRFGFIKYTVVLDAADPRP
jgi:ParB family chromosome partitioning protein